jgi:hypothetical protein
VGLMSRLHQHMAEDSMVSCIASLGVRWKKDKDFKREIRLWQAYKEA